MEHLHSSCLKEFIDMMIWRCQDFSKALPALSGFEQLLEPFAQEFPWFCSFGPHPGGKIAHLPSPENTWKHLSPSAARHLRLGGTHSSSSKQIFVSGWSRQTSHTETGIWGWLEPLLNGDMNYSNETPWNSGRRQCWYIKYTIKQIQTVGPTFLWDYCLHPPKKDKSPSTLQRLMGWLPPHQQRPRKLVMLSHVPSVGDPLKA